MLSHDKVSDGTIFILRLWDAGAAASHWVETLREGTARRWYEIYGCVRPKSLVAGVTR
jgi:hypothetical protein